MTKSNIQQLDLREYQHESDIRAISKMLAIPGFEMLSKVFIEQGLEHWHAIQYSGSNIKITKENLPKLVQQLEAVCSTLEIQRVPTIYITGEDNINAAAFGSQQPTLAISTGAVEVLEDKEMEFLLGHQCSYLKGSYSQYHTMAQILPTLTSAADAFGANIGNILSKPLEAAILRWFRLSQLSNDRAGLLACQCVEAAISIFIKISGLPSGVQTAAFRDAFLAQAESFKNRKRDNISKILYFFSEIDRTHPWTVLRASELLEWIEGGEYQDVLDRRSTRKIFTQKISEIEFCRTCEFRLDGTESFCPSCGQKLSLTLPNT